MSKQNQQRRAANKRRKAERQKQRGAAGPRERDRGSPADVGFGDLFETLVGDTRTGSRPRPLVDVIWDAVGAAAVGAARYGGLIDEIAAHDDAADVLDDVAANMVCGLWEHGWTPMDAVRAATKELSPAHGDLVAGIALEHASDCRRRGVSLHPRWLAQLDALSERKPTQPQTSIIDAVIQLLGFVSGLRDLPRTMPAPGERWAAPRRGGRHIDEGLLGRVRGLLAKAESTEFEAEAEALTAKAQELIARHAIDEALLHQPGEVGDAAVRRIPVDDPYAEAKSSLVARVAEANHCSSVFSPHYGWCDVFGYDDELDGVELLVTSLLAQAIAAMAREGSRVDHWGRSSTRSYRRSFLYGFAHRIGERLLETTESVVAQAATSSTSLLPVLASREEQVTAARDAAFPHLKTKRTTLSNASGYAAGQFAADQANLDVTSGALKH